jgi:hypothetical protein
LQRNPVVEIERMRERDRSTSTCSARRKCWRSCGRPRASRTARST